MKELTGFIVRSLVDRPDAVSVSEELEGARTVVVQVKVDPEDMGKVIGRQGRIAKALRTVVKASATKQGKKALVEIVE